MTALAYIAGTVLTVWLLFVFYAAVMALKRARDEGKLGPAMACFAYPTLYVGLVLDALVNIVVCTVIFLELPKEVLVTSRLTRHALLYPNTWRGKLSRWICSHLLDALDPSGCHCQ